MHTDDLLERAAHYVSGEMPATERESLEVVLEFHEELRAHVAGLQETVAGLAAAEAAPLAPPARLKARLLATVAALPAPAEPEALVVTDPGGLVLWVNPAFTAMCGWTLAELQGRKPGHLLQGPATDAAAVQRIREAVQARRTCQESLINYHKDGTPYHAEVRIAPVLADGGDPLWFVAKERKVRATTPAG
jgi:PAS domain S-box-containing protein